MDFELTEDETSLQEGMRSFVEGRSPPTTSERSRTRAAGSTVNGGRSWATPACSRCGSPKPTTASDSA